MKYRILLWLSCLPARGGRPRGAELHVGLMPAYNSIPLVVAEKRACLRPRV